MLGNPSLPFHGRPRHLIGLTGLLLILSLVVLLSTSHNVRSSDLKKEHGQGSNHGSTGWTWFSAPSNEPIEVEEDVISTSSVEEYIQSYLDNLQASVNKTYYLEEHGLKLGDTNLAAYTRELLSDYTTYLTPSSANDKSVDAQDERLDRKEPGWMKSTRSRLSLRPPVKPFPKVPKQIFTTDKSIHDLTEEFQRWKEIMPDWTIRYFDDAGLVDWVEGHFNGTRAEDIWKGLPERVLQTDVFRYMSMLVEGGIYTDSDTAPITHADHWGRPYTDLTPPLIKHLTRILSFSTTKTPSEDPTMTKEADLTAVGRERFSHPTVNDGNELGPPGLIVSIEVDSPDFGWTNWRKMARAIQITQWTFLARPGHPVFLDAVGRALKQAEEVSKQEKSLWKQYIRPSALEWTGPGVFSDCVFRYLLARYGIEPDELSGQKDPIRIGDVLILPAGSFSSVSPFGEQEQRAWAAVWHGFYGRWRGSEHHHA